jgi:phosphoglycolate phosphatase-like HAD superfamily hydrolase
MDTIALFDIDRTLIIGSKLKDEIAFPEAFKRVYGVNTNVDVINRHGLTDQDIIIKILKKNGLDEKTIFSGLHECMNLMAKIFYENINRDEFIIIKGVRELLQEMHENDIVMGLVTGNLEPIAWGSLRKVGLDHYFKFGGFGTDDIERANLVKIAIARAKNAGFSNNGKIFLFGDTPNDIISGRKAKIKTVGIATGIYSIEQLKNAGADFVFDSMERKNEIMKIIM